MYLLYDHYEGKQFVGSFDGYHELKHAMKEYREDTDGECDLEVVHRPNIGEEY